jgi:hypothetical protein
MITTTTLSAGLHSGAAEGLYGGGEIEVASAQEITL